MEFQQFYVVLLRKGPTWTPDDSPELEALQQRHLAHIRSMAASGKLLVAGPTEVHSDSDLRGLHILRHDAFETFDDLRATVEQDPSIRAGRLRAEYVTWTTSAEVVIAQSRQALGN